MPSYETLPPNNFLGLDEEHSGYEHSAALILPIPYEGTVSYGQGTREGPRAIIHASQQVELYDRELDDEPALTYGIHTLPFLAPVVSGPAGMVDAIAACAEEHLRTGKLLVGLGGEHTVSAGIARAVHAVHGDFVMVQIDAHSDLRDEYEGSPYSHASIARRVFDMGATIVQFGIRSICREEIELIRAERERLHVWFAEDVHAGGHIEKLAELVRGQTCVSDDRPGWARPGAGRRDRHARAERAIVEPGAGDCADGGARGGMWWRSTASSWRRSPASTPAIS